MKANTALIVIIVLALGAMAGVAFYYYKKLAPVIAVQGDANRVGADLSAAWENLKKTWA